MPAPKIDTSDMEKFQEDLKSLPEVSARFGVDMVGQILEALEEVMAPYPPQPDRERSGSFNTYVRGTGNLPRAAFKKTKTGKTKIVQKLATGKVRFTSERMSTKWRIIVTPSAESVDGELKNEASYSGYVSGHKKGANAGDDVPEQAAPHTETGWINIEDALSAASSKINKITEASIDRVIAYLKGGA